MISSALVFLLWGVVCPAWAELRICNDTDLPHDVAVGYKQDGRWVSEGWWTVQPAACVTPISRDLQYRFYYFHARNPERTFRHDRLSFCTQPGLFTIGGDNDCETRGYDKTYFAKIDTGLGNKSFRQNLSSHSEPWREPTHLEPGTWGVPFTGEAVFLDCSLMFQGGLQFCRFIGSGRVFTVVEDSRTPPEVFAALRRMTRATPVQIEGDWVGLYEDSVEMVLRSAKERAPSDEDRVLNLLQGDWYSEIDNNDQFTILGSERQNRYGGASTSVEYLSVMPFCGEFDGLGPFLYAWDSQGGTGLCYEIKEVTESVLDLVYLPRGTELRYLRQETGPDTPIR
ncbi:DUF1036 domain-containing protein [Pseudophaeobacter arcticus]|jgi:uncharacterized membrane protein|uniref:DUF1036 domain-containing protein n=2 Tax=Pseudophaeobacter arcticus TaxID=385492 RepID=UPI0039E264BD